MDGSCALRGPLFDDPLTPVFVVAFGVWSLLPSAGVVQLLQPFLGPQNLSTGVMSIAGVEVVLRSIVVLLDTYGDKVSI